MKRILVADDDNDLREFLSDELSNAGYQVTAVRNGADAVVEAVEGRYDLVLMDMYMPGLDGMQAIRVLRKTSPRLPVIGLTGYVGRGYMSEAMTYNVTCLSKPVKINELLSEVREKLG
jgi:two-component system cell cycle response regulator CpdR